MDLDKITAELNRRFREPLPEYYSRRIIFWHDEEEEFRDQIPELHLDQAKVLVLTGRNTFAAKKLLNVDDPDSNYLVYIPGMPEKEDDDWLLDVELYSEAFHGDMISLWMEEMELENLPQLRKVVKGYRKFFNAKARREKIRTFRNQFSGSLTPARLELAMMAALTSSPEAQPERILRAVLQDGVTEQTNRAYQELVNYHMTDEFWQMVCQGTGYQEEKPKLEQVAVHLLLTAASGALPAEVFSGLEQFLAPDHQVYCYTFASDWLHSGDGEDLKHLAAWVERETRLSERLAGLSLEKLGEGEIFPCLDRIILQKIMETIKEHRIEPDKVRQLTEKRRTSVYYEKYRYFYDGLGKIGEIQAFCNAHGGGFHETDPGKIWKAYTDSYFRVDTCYREFIRDYDGLLKEQPDSELLDLFRDTAVEAAERLYTRWFLENLGSCWTAACAELLANQGTIPGIVRQADFYRSIVAPAAETARIFVVISDAMRYEVASALKEQLEQETQCQVSLDSMAGIFPTITKFGMAALLPHEKLSVEVKSGKTNRLAVLADGQSTEANYRDKLLKKAHSRSGALKYQDLVSMKRKDRQEQVKGLDIVYLYHDTIDEAGHTERSIFGACDEAITELKNAVRMITNDFGGTRILITSDHGFLYTASPLGDLDKVEQGMEEEQVVELGRRYAIAHQGSAPEYLLPVKFLDGETPFAAFGARENIRIKVKGAGSNFVHGGFSLQEMVVPVIDYHFLRNANREYQKNRSRYDTRPVTVELLSPSHRVTNTSFYLDFYQKEAIGSNRTAAVCQVYFADQEDRILSNVVSIVADKDSEDNRERTFRCRLTLKPRKYSSREPYYLVIADENGMEKARVEFQIDIALNLEEVDYFS